MAKNRIYMGGTLIAAAFLRCLFMDTRGIIYDDAFSFFLSKQSIENIIKGTAADTMPPLYYFLLHFWMWGGESLWYLRLLSILFSISGLLLLYLIIQTLFDERSAIIASVLAAVSPLQIYHAQDIRMYALLQVTQLGFVWCFVRILKGQPGQNNKPFWLGMVISGVLALYSHNLAGFMLISPAIYLIIKREWAFLRRISAVYFAMGILFLPWILELPGQISKVQAAFWTPRPGLVEVLQILIQFTANLPLPDMLWVGIAVVIGLQLVIVLLLESLRLKVKQDEKMFLVILIFTAPLLTFITSYIVRPVFVARGFLVCSMFFYGFAGWVIAKRWKTFIGYFALGSLIFCEMMGLPYQLTFNSFPRSPFQQAGLFLQNNMGPGIRMINDDKLSFFPIQYFSPSLKQSFLIDEPGSPNDTLAPATQQALSMVPERDIQSAVGDARQIYFVVFKQTILEYQAINQKHPVLDWLSRHFKTRQEDNFNDLVVYHFSQP